MSDILRVSINHWRKEEIRKLSPENYERLRQVLLNPSSMRDGQEKCDYVSGEFLMYSDDVEFVDSLGISMELKGLRHMQKIADHPLEGQTTNIHIADLGLLAITEVTNLDNACTDELQRHLDEEWRILAVCPQLHGQRRPDYILGRTRTRK